MVRPGAILNNDYAGNVVDLCPVGALTDKDFRFKRRVWFLQSVSSICQLCSRGCNVRIDYDIDPYHQHKRNTSMRTHRTAHTEYARIQRIKPRINEEVNGHWICDHGRYGYRPTDAADRLLQAHIRTDNGIEKVEVSAALKQIASGITTSLGKGHEKVAIVASPLLTNEEVFAVHRLFCDRMNLKNVDHRLPIDSEWYGDDLLRTPDPFPNRTGCEWIGLEPSERGVGIDGLEEAINSGRIDTILSILADPLMFLSISTLNKLKRRYSILRQLPEQLMDHIDVVVPAAAWGEYQGTFTNFRGRLQRLEQAFEPLGDARPVWRHMIDISSMLKKPLNWKNFEDVFAAMTHNVHLFASLSWEEIGEHGFLTNRLPVEEVA